MRASNVKIPAIILIGLLLVSCGNRKVVIDLKLYNLGPKTGKIEEIIVESSSSYANGVIDLIKIEKNDVKENDLEKIIEMNVVMANKINRDEKNDNSY